MFDLHKVLRRISAVQHAIFFTSWLQVWYNLFIGAFFPTHMAAVTGNSVDERNGEMEMSQ